jgi:transposase
VFRNYAEESFHSQLRSYLVEAAWIAIRKDTEMQNYYRNIKVKRKSVIIKVAHKMARRILSVIKTETHIKLIEI